MSARLAEIARRTLAIAESGRYHNDAGTEIDIRDTMRAAIAGTRLYLPEEPLTYPGPGAETCGVEVTHESTLQAVRRLGPGTVCLVFASAKNPGGGFLGGAQAQEESIARASGLYPCLHAASEFYAFHRGQRDLRYSDRVIYSPGVPVFRDDKGNLLDEPHATSFLTAAAPNLGAIVRSQPEHTTAVPAVLAQRARRVLAVAAAHGHRTVVLGAWGCGVFRNDPAAVADAFAEALRIIDRFDRVTFAIRDSIAGSVYCAFAQRFSRSGARPVLPPPVTALDALEPASPPE